MITFNQFLIEAKIPATPEQCLSYINNNCKPFLDMMRPKMKTGKFLWRGMRDRDNTFFIDKIRKNRTPVDSDPDDQKLVDQWFNKRFGIKFRASSIFTTDNETTAGSYGDEHIIFPIGEFTACWSNDVKDLYGNIFDNIRTGNKFIISFYKKYKNEVWIDEFIELCEHHTDYYIIHKKLYKKYKIDFNDLFMPTLGYQVGNPINAKDTEVMITGNKYLAIFQNYFDENDKTIDMAKYLKKNL